MFFRGPLAAGLLAGAALAAAAETAVINRVEGPLARFGESAIREAAGDAALGSITILISPELKPDAFRIRKQPDGYEIAGGDARGAMYGALDFAEQIELAGAPRDKQIAPSLPVRALKFNIPLPGTGYLSEEDLANNQWFWDLGYWQAFLDMAARNRYNALTFWSAHPFGRMVRLAKYPEAAEVEAAQLDRNIQFFRKLFQMAADRGLDTYLVTWNIHVSRAFAARHKIPASGFDSELVRDYQRECIQALFATYPVLTGIGTAAGERMSGMTVRQKLDWVAATYFAALRQVGRPAPFILRYWQSEPEATMAMLESVKHSGPVYLDIKFNGEHMYSSTRPHLLDRRWIELAGSRYRLLWHLRNDDVFILRWGDPDFVRETLRNMGGASSAGFVEGSELDVPGVDRIHTAAARAHLDWRYKFEKHWFRYMLWGRLGYFEGEPDDTWRGHFLRRFGKAGAEIYEAMRQAGKIVPLVTSYHWNYMNGDWYPEGSIGSWNTSYEQPLLNYRRAAMYHDIRTYVFNNTIDAKLASIPESLAGSNGAGPLDVAERLESFGRRALELIREARPRVERGHKEFACTEADMQAYGNLGVYYAEKLRGATHLARFLFHGDEAERGRSIQRLEAALAAWRGVVAATENHYIPHEVWLFGQFDWKRYSPDVERDIQIAREARPLRPDSLYDAEGLHHWLEYTYGLLGRKASVTPAAVGKPIIVPAHAVSSVTAPMELQDRYIVLAGTAAKNAGESITGARDFVAHAASATYQVDLPSDGGYELSVSCWWPERGGSFAVLVDESNTRSYTLRGGPAQSWTLQKVNSVLRLGAGRHTIRFFGRQPGSRIERFILTPVK